MTPARWVAVGALAALIAIALYLGVAVALALTAAAEHDLPDLTPIPAVGR